MEKGGIAHATLEGKYLITTAGKLVWITLILKNKPFRFARELLTFFCQLFEDQYEREIKKLYTEFKGDISVFQRDPYSKQSLDKKVESIFHLYLTFPFRIGSRRGVKISSKAKKILQCAKTLARKTKSQFLLARLFTEIIKSLKISNIETVELIYKLIESEALVPVRKE